jgi:hypothetical protein
MSNNFIRYGDFIVIKSSYIDKSEQLVEGCISSKGYCDLKKNDLIMN